MNKFLKTLKNKKKSILSLVLAFLLTLTFNYTPISVISSLFTSAYTATSKTTYYAPSNTGEEPNIKTFQIEAELEKYFEGSKKNFNIKTDFYDPEFESTFGYYVDLYFKNFNNTDFVNAYTQFLTKGGYTDIYNYYTERKSALSSKTFKGFVEHFVSTTGQGNTYNEVEIPALFPAETYENYKSRFYCSLANYLTPDDQQAVTGNDGVEEGKDFYENSVSYKRVKTFIDTQISKVLAIYGYDGKTQNKYVASILANGAPVETEKKIESNYYSSLVPNVTYEQEDGKIVVYTFGSITIPNDYVTAASPFVHKHQIDLSIRDNKLLRYREVQYGEDGYNENFISYYKFDEKKTIPYDTTNGIYDIYVLDDTAKNSETKQATYDSLFFDVITTEELNANKNLYINIPYYSNDVSYFDKIIDNNILTLLGNSKEKFYDLFTYSTADGIKSKLYFKLASKTQNHIYYDPNTVGNLDQFLVTYEPIKQYLHEVNNLPASSNEYVLITKKDDYDKTNTFIKYNKKKSTEYGETTYTYGAEYEMKQKPNIPLEKHKVPSEFYELEGGKKKVFVLADTGFTATNGTVCHALPQTTLDEAMANLYVKAPASVQTELNKGQAESYVFYYKHTLTENINKIYVLDDKNTNPDVYKNLNYTVITSSDYLSTDITKNYSNYLIIPENDENYNKNLKLYYKYDTSVDQSTIFVQNALTGLNARYIIDKENVSEDKRALYIAKGFTIITQAEFNANSEFYKQIDKDDANYYDPQNTKLYFKYVTVNTDERKVYLYSKNSSDLYETFTNAVADYAASDYELIEPGEPGYVEGSDLYYKKIRTGTNFTKKPNKTVYYHYTSASSTKTKLEKNSFYAFSFYVYTNGYYDTDDVTTNGSLPIEASVYITATTSANEVINEIKLEKISTNGKWVQYFAFLATDNIESNYVMSMYLGNKESILGSQTSSAITKVTGNVLFDNIQVYKINETDYVKKAINDNPAQEKLLKNDLGDEIADRYADEFNNEVIVANNETAFASNTFDLRLSTQVSLYDSNMFNFDALTSTFSSLSFVPETTGYTPYSDSWQFYISRTDSDPGNETTLKIYQEAYKSGDLSASIIDEKDFVDDKKAADEANENKNDDDTNSSSNSTTPVVADKPYVEYTFEENNKVLKLENNNNFLDLGITSNTFTIKQFQYYKLTVWIYSTDKDAQATITVNSVYGTMESEKYGKLMTATTTVDANINDYATAPTNEYGWIPVNFYLAGNSLHSQDCTLVLSASENSVVYFDKITIQNISSDIYKDVKADTTNKTLSLTDSSSVLSSGISNGYFNNVNVVSDYKNYDYTLPKTPKDWTTATTNSNAVIAGAIPTNSDYLSQPANFFTKYNEGLTVANEYDTNIFAINAPATKTDSVTGKEYSTTNKYSIYASAKDPSSTSGLKASTVYRVEFDFYYSQNISKKLFDGTMFGKLYYGSYAPDKLLATIKLDESEITPNTWNTYTFYIQTNQINTSSTTVYLEFGVENAVGTCFFQKAIVKVENKQFNEIRDELMQSLDADLSNDETPVNADLLKNVKFVNLSNINSSITTVDKNKFDLYDSKEFTTDIVNTATNTVGKAGVAIASYFTSSDESSYKVTINKVEYYLAPAVDSDGNPILDEDDNPVYKLYSDTNYKNEVTKIDGKTVTVNGTKSVSLGSGKSATETDTTETKKTNYLYSFEKDVEINNVFISADELNNAQSQNVLVLANSYSTDYTVQTHNQIFKNSLATSAYYVLKIYVKTSDFENDEFGLNIDIPAISTSWKNINTTKIADDNVQKVENGFVCYQVLITTNTSSIANLVVNFSLGTSNSTGSGYALVSGIEIEKFATEKLFNEYVESDKVTDDESVMKKFYGKVSETTKTDDTTEAEEDEKMTWATFFYIFSSLLLVAALAIALVAIFLKKHPIKIVKQEQNEHERNSSPVVPAKQSSNDVIEVTKPTRKSKSVKKSKTNKDDFDEPTSNPDEGFI